MRWLALIAAFLVTTPGPLRGEPAGRTGLRLLVADTPPFVLDVDRGTITRVRGGDVMLTSPLSIVNVGGRGGVVSVGTRLFGVRGPGAAFTRLPEGERAVPAAAGAAVGVQARSGRGRCPLRSVALTGRVLRAARVFPCTTVSDPAAGPLGLVVNRTRIVDPANGRTVFSSREGILGVLGGEALVVDSEARLALVDVASRTRRELPPASTLGGVPHVTVDGSGRYAILEYGDPAPQVVDLWLLDRDTSEVTQLPGMPASVALKRTSVEWTRDGRLVLLGETGNRSVVALWRPGDPRWAVKRVRLPERDGGSDSFAVLR